MRKLAVLIVLLGGNIALANPPSGPKQVEDAKKIVEQEGKTSAQKNVKDPSTSTMGEQQNPPTESVNTDNEVKHEDTSGDAQ